LSKFVGGVEMQRINDDMPTSIVLGAVWRKSRYSNPCGSCVEVAELPGGRVGVRHSRHLDGPVLIYSSAGIAVFVQAVKAGEFGDGARPRMT
jgi:Domain of unknown function (DUF397)